jgi:hypothetical protein
VRLIEGEREVCSPFSLMYESHRDPVLTRHMVRLCVLWHRSRLWTSPFIEPPISEGDISLMTLAGELAYHKPMKESKFIYRREMAFDIDRSDPRS